MVKHRNSYKGKWLSLLAKLEKEGKMYSPIIDTSPMEVALEEARLNVAKLELAILSLYNAAVEATDMINEFTDVGELTFAKVESLEHNTAEDTIRFTTGLVYTLMDRFGLAATAVDHKPQPAISPDSLVDLTSGIKKVKSMTKKLLSNRGDSEKTLVTREPFVGVKGKAVHFELMSPIAEQSEVPTYNARLLDFETLRRDKLVVKDKEGIVIQESTKPSRSSSKATSPTRGRLTAKETGVINVGASSSRSSTRSESRPTELKRNLGFINTRPAKIDHRKVGHHHQPVPVTMPKDGWRSSLPLLDDINWVSLRKALNHTDQLYVKDLDDLELHKIMTEEVIPKMRDNGLPKRGLATRLRSLI